MSQNKGKVLLVGKGNANIVVSFGDDDKILYRLSIRFKDSLRVNNEYTLTNWKFIQNEIVPRLGSYLCAMDLVELQLTSEIIHLYSFYVSIQSEKCNVIQAFKLPNLKPTLTFNTCLHEDHQTILYCNSSQNIYIMEIKPKWLHNPLKYCRNCTHNKYKGRDINYCYRNILFNKGENLKNIINSCNIPNEKLDVMAKYFSQEDNVLQKLYNEQLKVYQEIQNGHQKQLALLMTLRDVTCFVKWDFCTYKGYSKLDTTVKASIIDVDLKPSEKKQHWVKIENILNNFIGKVYH